MNIDAYDPNIKKVNLLNLDRTKMRNFMHTINEKNFRADQIMHWIYQRFCSNFDHMTNLTTMLRCKLKEVSCIEFPYIIKEIISEDYTIKWLISVPNGVIETIYIPEKKRGTLCISSQVGCALKCQFCATGINGFTRNLLVSEIVGQIWLAYQKINNNIHCIHYPITNIVFMGMGEPLLNLHNVITALNIISDSCGFRISKKKIVISTAGIVPALDQLSKSYDVKLAISLHASNDMIRNQLMPINKKYNIAALLESVLKFFKQSQLNKHGITIEYIMLHNINDSIIHAKELVKILHKIPSKINLIPWNYLPNSDLQCSSINTIHSFSKYLINKGLITTIRKTRGQDIQAACGQLTGSNRTIE
ncbi:23S rRNA (adenine(2503)-C(2))-methyltransferase RlmN [Buchnera aphidicola (Takecallis taiwana)]|uniref:23S rRNA (adenine(2503)-C(2))-methyltransferase RlmN n=1 Tax=Buchnera aphidicola TaxID=9 RepID=UPI0031B6C334